MTAHTVDAPADEQFEVAVATMKMLGDATRLRIVWTLLHGEHSVGAIAEHLGVRPAAVSQHLAKLRLARVVRIRRDGNRLFYAVDDAHVRHLVEEALFHSHHIAGQLPGRATSAAVTGTRRRA